MKKIVIVLILIAVIGAVFIGRYDNMFNTVAEIFDKYSVEAVIDGEIVTRNFLIKYTTPLDIVRAYNIVKGDGEDVFLQKLVEKYQAEIENAEKIPDSITNVYIGYNAFLRYTTVKATTNTPTR